MTTERVIQIVDPGSGELLAVTSLGRLFVGSPAGSPVSYQWRELEGPVPPVTDADLARGQEYRGDAHQPVERIFRDDFRPPDPPP